MYTSTHLPNGTKVGFNCPSGRTGNCATVTTVPPISGSMCLATDHIVIDMNCLSNTNPSGSIKVNACWFTKVSTNDFDMVVTWGNTITVKRASDLFSESCCNKLVAEIVYTPYGFRVDLPQLITNFNNAMIVSDPSIPKDNDIDVNISTTPSVYPLEIPPIYVISSPTFNNAMVIESGSYLTKDNERDISINNNMPYLSYDAMVMDFDLMASFINAPVVSSLIVFNETDTDINISNYPPYSVFNPPETPNIYFLRGTVTTSGSPLMNVSISGSNGFVAFTDVAGKYEIPVLSGSYTLTPSLRNYSFVPPYSDVVATTDISGIDFDATYNPFFANTYYIDGDYYFGVNGTYVFTGEYYTAEYTYEYGIYELIPNVNYKLYRNTNNPQCVLAYSYFNGGWIVNNLYSGYNCAYVSYDAVDPPSGTYTDYPCTYTSVTVSII
jgi:hypothetical protein